MTFLAQSGRVYMSDKGGSYELKPDEIAMLLALFDRERAIRPWLELDEAAQAAGYPPSVSSLSSVTTAKDWVRAMLARCPEVMTAQEH